VYKYTIYLLKDTVTDPNDCLTDKALNSFPASAKEIEFAETHEYDDIEGFAFFNDATPPKWSAAFEQAAILPNEIDTNSSGALVFAKEAGRWFAISFGIGHFSLDKRKVDMSFGLRCVINMLKDENVSSREGFEIATAQRGAIQAASVTPFSDLGTLGKVEVVKRISGRDDSGGAISGATSFKFASEKPVTELSEDLFGLLKARYSNAYVGSGFEVIDQLRPIVDKSYVEELDAALVKAVNDNSGEVELVIPLIASQENDVSYIRFMRTSAPTPPVSVDVSLDAYRAVLQPGSVSDIESLKKHQVMAHDQTGKTLHYDSVYDCLVGTIESDVSGTDEKYVINEGSWYFVSSNFKKIIDDFFSSVRDYGSDGEFEKLKYVSAKLRKKDTDGLEAELTYNTRVAANNDLVLMDQEFVKTPILSGRGFEFCDLLDTGNKRIIHVKKGSSQSSVLSHFFNQGVTPLTLYDRDTEFRDKTLEVIKGLPSPGAGMAASDLETNGTGDYTVHFLIVDKKRKDGTFNMPFFSRITLYDRAKTIGNAAQGVTISFVEHEEPL
jgi:uncharacterized protein (TIGR04141 family)|tara:strand:+ start:136 stop:1794 length:1659 start_codon:yes stop_codon:yes gene_type:complete